MKKGLYIVATPIGNLGDISQRAVNVLQEADIIACEDTRVTKKLFSLLGLSIKRDFIPLHDHNETEQSENLINLIKQGKSIALVSDAGSPLISDPGYKLVNKARGENIYVTVIPGACAIICALQLSGLPSNRFMFAGFIPNKEKARVELFNELKNINSTLIFYETAPRLLKTLTAAQKIFNKREAAVIREISKIYEECVSGSIDYLQEHFTIKEPKGEIVFIVAPPTESKEEIDVEKLLKTKMRTLSLKSAVKEIAEENSISKTEVYKLALRLKDE